MMDHKYYGLEASLSPEDSSLLPGDGESISSLCHTYLDDLDTPGNSLEMEGSSRGRPHQTQRDTRPAVPSVSQWGGQECVLWAKAVCQSAGVDENSLPLPLTSALSDMTGGRLLQLTTQHLCQLVGPDHAKLFHTHIQALKKHKSSGNSRAGRGSQMYPTSPYRHPSQDYQYPSHDSQPIYQDSYPSSHLQGPYDYQHYEPQHDYPHHDYPHHDYPHHDYPHHDYPHQCKQETDYPASPSISPSTYLDSPCSSSYHDSSSFARSSSFPTASSSSSSLSPSFPDSWDLESVDLKDLDCYLPEEGRDPLSEDLRGLDLQKDLLGAAQVPTEEAMSPVPPVPQHSEALKKIPTKTRRRERGPKSWEFLMRLLASPKTNPSLVRWEDEAAGTFRLTQPTLVAQLWGGRSDKHDLSYVNFARGLRYHYTSGALQPVSERQLVYRCGPQALKYLKELGEKECN